MAESNVIKLTVNGTQHTVVNPGASDKLISWLRKEALLTGTKHMCLEGGCGACVVTLKRTNPATGEPEILSVNSCLFPLISANNCEVTTVEGLGSCRTEYGNIQKTFAEGNATQCGYCTPGFVMATHSLLEKNPNLTAAEAEAALDGNICRCTGYRPILDAVKSLCIQDCKGELCDIEDAGLCSRKQINKVKITKTSTLCLKSDDFEDWVWLVPTSLDEVVELVKQNANKTIRFVSGFTSVGVFPEDVYDVYVDVNLVPELHQINETADFLTVGSNVTISNLNEHLRQLKDTDQLIAALYKLTSIMANTHIRNAGSWVGNLVMKKDHSSLASDLFTPMESIGVKLTVMDCVSGKTSECALAGADGFMNIGLQNKIVVNAKIPKSKVMPDQTISANSFKVKSRHQNAVAYVNACFTATTSSYKIIGTPSLVFGGISSTFVHATNTEAYIVGKDLNSEDTLKGALSTLQSEIAPTMENLADTSTEYRKSVACGLFYKFYLTLCNPDSVAANIKSASEELSRGVSTSTQTYKTDPSTYPVSEAIPKITASKQAAGELKYTNDITAAADECYATFVMSSVANADIDEIDSSEASIMLGFKKIITAKDLGTLKNTVWLPDTETQILLAEDHVGYVGQPVAIVVADTEANAFLISKAVQVTYKNQLPGVYTAKDAAAKGLFIEGFTQNFTVGDADTAIANAKNKITGEVNTGCQYHYYMETQICRAVQTDIGMDLYSATQCQDWVQSIAASVLGWNTSRINVITSRLGGAYGGKAPNSIIPAMAAVVASYLSDSSVRFVTNLEQCMSSHGRRPDYNMSYTVGFDTDGVLQGIDITYIADGGQTANQADVIKLFAMLFADSVYHCDNWNVTTKITRSNTPTTCQARSPCSVQLTFAISHIIDQIANELKQPSPVIQRLNFYKANQTNLAGEPLPYCSITSVFDTLLSQADWDKRQGLIESFNNNNKWKKKGLAVTAMKLPIAWAGGFFTMLLTIYHADGSVVVSFGGIEMGQGMDTKVAQATAAELGISMDLITIQCSSSVTTPNSVGTGGSIGSDLNCVAAVECCKILNERISPVKAASKAGISWTDLIAKCYNEGVNLTAQYMTNPATDKIVKYNTYGVACSEVEVDILTGVYNLKQVDLLYDCGVSINPDIDIGQVEGAFMMGVGMHTTENMIYESTNGQLINHSTWTYKPPMGKDIPEIWNVTLLPDAPNPSGVLRSKASGEPPLCLSDSVVFALKRCVQSFRGSYDYFQMDSPATVEKVHDYCNVSVDQMTLK